MGVARLSSTDPSTARAFTGGPAAVVQAQDANQGPEKVPESSSAGSEPRCSAQTTWER